MDLFKSKIVNRIVIWKTIWLIFGGIGFIVLPMVVSWEADLLLRFAILMWYISVWAIVWVFWIFDKHPIFNFKIKWYYRWLFIWAWLNLVLILFMHDNLILLIQWTCMEWYSPWWMITEWMVFWLIADFFATKFAWEWKTTLD
jgi:hypothetical protein